MSNGYVACRADTISWANLRKLCPSEAKAFQRAMKAAGVDFNAVAQEIENDEKLHDRIRLVYDRLCTAFNRATTIRGSSLALSIGFHRDGDRYDDLPEDTGYWCVDGVYELSEAGRWFKDVIEPVSFVEFV